MSVILFTLISAAVSVRSLWLSLEGEQCRRCGILRFVYLLTNACWDWTHKPVFLFTHRKNKLGMFFLVFLPDVWEVFSCNSCPLPCQT